ncbi:hypothetical protein BDR06DRAFT_414815 [Suillus hirtellus]|nr:hypothetical protein BDR06DRAFT_414815 [Suillus hirtellus]
MCLSAELFDHSTAQASIFPLSNILGSEFLDAYIGLIANQKVSGFFLVTLIFTKYFHVAPD